MLSSPRILGCLTLILCAICAFVPCSVTVAQDYVFSFDTSETAPSGGSVDVRCLLNNPGGNLAGWSFAICQDSPDFEITNASNGAVVEIANGGAPAAFQEINVCAGEGVIQGVVVDFVGINTLPPGVDYEMAVIEILLLGADDTLVPIQYCDFFFSCASSATETLVVPPGGTAPFVPTQVEGLIEIGGIPPFSLSTAFTTASVEQASSAAADVFLNAPLPYYGFSLGMTHDGSQLAIAEVTAGSSLSALNGGAGPEYLLVDTDPVGADGLVVACLASISDALTTLPAGTEEQLMTVTYNALALSTPGITNINFSEDLIPAAGSPATPIVISLGSTAAIVSSSGDSIEITPAPLGTPFKRGDFDGNGGVNLADPINMLQYLFSNGPEPSCLKIIDIDDSGVIQLNDPVLMLSYLFSGGAAPEAPFEECGIDPTDDDIPCDSYAACP
ncbi:MAG: hypothetical protein GWP35_00805 [Proteobacteria bacterium]|nr:hypothetical protein [Pseudomonadota bacterium]